jgi:hypothetical protein
MADKPLVQSNCVCSRYLFKQRFEHLISLFYAVGGHRPMISVQYIECDEFAFLPSKSGALITRVSYLDAKMLPLTRPFRRYIIYRQ